MIKKLVSVAVILALLCMFTVSSFAQESQYSAQDNNKISELIKDGLTEEEASRVLEFDNIRIKLEKSNQYLDTDENGAIIVKTVKGKEKVEKYDLAQDDLELINNQSKELKKHKKISANDRQEKLNKYLEDHPNASKARLNFEDGSWLEYSITSTLQSEIDSDNVNVYYDVIPRQAEVNNSTFPRNDRYFQKNEIKAFVGGSYVKFYVQQYADVSINNSVTTSAQTAGSTGVGLGTIATPVIQGIISETTSANPTQWTQTVCSQEVTASITGSAAVSIGVDALVQAGVEFSTSITASIKFTAYAMIKNSIANQHYYYGVYGPF